MLKRIGGTPPNKSLKLFHGRLFSWAAYMRAGFSHYPRRTDTSDFFSDFILFYLIFFYFSAKAIPLFEGGVQIFFFYGLFDVR